MVEVVVGLEAGRRWRMDPGGPGGAANPFFVVDSPPPVRVVVVVDLPPRF